MLAAAVRWGEVLGHFAFPLVDLLGAERTKVVGAAADPVIAEPDRFVVSLGRVADAAPRAFDCLAVREVPLGVYLVGNRRQQLHHRDLLVQD